MTLAAAGTATRVPVIEVSGLHTRFGDVTVHDGIGLSVEAGEVFGIAGGSGSGKTLLMREIVMLQKPTSGSIRLFGREVTTIGEDEGEPLKRRCGVMFQHGALFSALTVEENVAAPLVESTDLSRALIREIALLKIALVGLPPDSAGKHPSELSGGMRKRAAMARAIALDPDILFLDEPSSGLDPVSAGGIDDLIVRMNELLGLTIVMVTHDLDTLWRAADRVAILGNGRIAGIGTMEELCLSDDPLIWEYFHGPRGRSARAQARIRSGAAIERKP